MKKFLASVSAGLAMVASTALPVLANPAGAPASSIGPTVSGAAQTVSPNFGLAVCKPAGLTQTEDDGALTLLGLTPPGNTP